MEFIPLNENQCNSNCKNPNRDKWTVELQSELLELTEKYDQKWKEISIRIRFFGEEECASKFQQLRNRWRFGEWTNNEHFFLEKFALKNDDINWYRCSVLIKTKSPKNCRRRWAERQNNVDINRPWADDEQIFIFDMIRAKGFSWKTISENLWGRPANKIKNLFYSQVKKIKDSKIKEYLKSMICHPTCANNSKLFYKLRKFGMHFLILRTKNV